MRNKLIGKTLIVLFVGCLLSLPTSAQASDLRFEKAMPEGGKAILTFATEQLQTMTDTPFAVNLTGSTGKAFSDAAVSLKLIMPAMAMPPNNPKAIWKGSSYQGNAIFTMAGEWQAIMIIQRPGHDVIDLNFKLGQVRMK